MDASGAVDADHHEQGSVGSQDPNDGEDQAEDAVRDLLAADGPPDFEPLPGPLFWPGLRPKEAADEWRALWRWVENLVQRYPHLDHRVIPPCWWRHNSHVEALQALRDHERVSFQEIAPASAAADWQWRLALIEGRLREWTAHTGCGAAHRERTTALQAPGPEWERMVEDERELRLTRERTGTVICPGG